MTYRLTQTKKKARLKICIGCISLGVMNHNAQAVFMILKQERRWKERAAEINAQRRLEKKIETKVYKRLIKELLKKI
jgi:hypothetical protein